MGSMEHWRMTEEGEVREWIPAPNGGHIGIVKGSSGDIFTISDEHFVRPDDIPRVRAGSRVRFAIKRFEHSPGHNIEGLDMETNERYQCGATRQVELVV